MLGVFFNLSFFLYEALGPAYFFISINKNMFIHNWSCVMFLMHGPLIQFFICYMRCFVQPVSTNTNKLLHIHNWSRVVRITQLGIVLSRIHFTCTQVNIPIPDPYVWIWSLLCQWMPWTLRGFMHFFRMHIVWPRASYQSPLAILRPCTCEVLPRQWSAFTYNRPQMTTKVVMLPNVPQHRGESQDQPLGSGVTSAAVGPTWNALDSMLHPRGILLATFEMPCIFLKIQTHGKKWH